MQQTAMRLVEPSEVIPVDQWLPGSPSDVLFDHARSAIILNIAPLYGLESEKENINYFVMSPNRCYNGDTKVKYKKEDKNVADVYHTITDEVLAKYDEMVQAGLIKEYSISVGFRDHFCRYINYFEKFYDKDHWLFAFYARIKFMIDYMPGYPEYTAEGLISDLKRCIIDYRNKDGSFSMLHACISNMVNDNYFINQTYENSMNECLAYNNHHAKILMEISIIFNMGIPILSHYAFKAGLASVDVNRLFMMFFDEVYKMTKEKHGVDMFSKLYETTESNVIKNVKRNGMLWDMQDIRGINPTTLIFKIVEQITRQLIPKYVFDKNVVFFNFNAILSELRYKVTDNEYEFKLASVSSSDRDEDNNSAADKFEAHISKVNEALVLQSNVNCDSTMEKIEQLYGPFSNEEIEFYKKELTRNGRPIKTEYQTYLISYLFLKYFKDKGATTLVNNRNYIKLMIAAKRFLYSAGLTILPEIIAGRAERIVTKKVVNKKIKLRIQMSEMYPRVQAKYQNPKLEDNIFGHIAKILASDFRMIDFHHPELNGRKLEPIPELLCEEFLQFVMMI